MKLKSVLTNGVVALLAFTMTIELVSIVRASQCLYYCDDQVEWVKGQYNEPGKAGVNQCVQFQTRHQYWLYTADSTKDDSTPSPGTTRWEAYDFTSCNHTCSPVYLPVKTSGSTLDEEPLRQGNAPNRTCSMKAS